MNFVTPTTPDPIARARELGPAIEAAADEIERTQRIPEPLLSQLHAARMCRMLLPRSVDGDEVEPWVYLRAIEEISRHDGSVGWNVFVANSSALIAPFLEPESMRAIFADPRAVVAWGPPNESKAIAVPGGYRVSGTVEFRVGLPPGHLDGRALPRGGARRFAATECCRQANGADAAVPCLAGGAA